MKNLIDLLIWNYVPQFYDVKTQIIGYEFILIQTIPQNNKICSTIWLLGEGLFSIKILHNWFMKKPISPCNPLNPRFVLITLTFGSTLIYDLDACKDLYYFS